MSSALCFKRNFNLLLVFQQSWSVEKKPYILASNCGLMHIKLTLE